MRHLTLTQDQYQEMLNVELDYSKNSGYFHCHDCLDKFLNSPEHSEKSPRDALHEEIAMHRFTYPNGTTALIMTVWCKRCEKLVWDSRHLQPIGIRG